MAAARNNGVRKAKLAMYDSNNNKFTPSVEISPNSRSTSRKVNDSERVRSSKGDMSVASEGLRTAQANRNAETNAQKNKTRNKGGQFISESDRRRNARNARAKQSYDIKRAFGVSVG